MQQTLYRDTSLMYWVLVPITLVMITTGILRHFVGVVLTTKQSPKHTTDTARHDALTRSLNFRKNHSCLPRNTFVRRRQQMISDLGVLLSKSSTESAHDAAHSSPDANAMNGMMEMMKNNMSTMIPQTLIMGWINAFFTGFVIMKLPFPLTIRFKSMLQSSVLTEELDARWVSSLSWYFLNLFGLQAIFNLILGDENGAGYASQQFQMASTAPTLDSPFSGKIDWNAQIMSEIENLKLIKHEDILWGVENRMAHLQGK